MEEERRAADERKRAEEERQQAERRGKYELSLQREEERKQVDGVVSGETGWRWQARPGGWGCERTRGGSAIEDLRQLRIGGRPSSVRLYQT
jgi:hypothetical protein